MLTNLTCTSGVPDCGSLYLWNTSDCGGYSFPGCSPYSGVYRDIQGNNVILVISMLFAASMAFGIGANDSANSWGTSVGSGAIPLRWACIIGGLMEWLGAVTLGYGVSKTIQKGVAPLVTPQDCPVATCWSCGHCDSNMPLYGLGMLGALIGASFFLFLATFTKMPVSTTHAIVGGVVGITLVGSHHGTDCLNWSMSGGLGGIVASWGISPLLSGIIGMTVYKVTHYLILSGANPFKRALLAVPVLMSITLWFVVFLILLKSNQTKKLEKGFMAAAATGVAILMGVMTQFCFIPRIKSNLRPLKFTALQQTQSSDIDQDDSYHALDEIDEAEKSKEVFKYLLVFVAALESFAHGANDTANATGAFAAVVGTYEKGLHDCSDDNTPWYIMFGAGFFVFLGMFTFGRRVIQTIGKDIAKIDYHRGYCIEFASTTTVVIATLLNFPVSTTHCQVGAVVFVGWVSLGKENVSWKLFGRIALTWIVTLPLAGGTAALYLVLMKNVFAR